MSPDGSRSASAPEALAMSLPPGARLLKASLRKRGNVLLLFGEGDAARVLKLYRRRYGTLGECLSSLSHRLIERKRGVGARERFETERETMALWERHGFDVFRRYDLPLPAGIEPPGLWLEHCPGETLANRLRDPGVPAGDSASLMERLGALLSRRHRLALELDEPLLAHEHATFKHFLLSGERLITFDFEGGYRRGFPAIEALAQELASTLRSFHKYGGAGADRLLDVWMQGYADSAQLRRIAAFGIHHRGIYRRLRRWYDRRQRAGGAKTEGLRRLLEKLDGTSNE
jgi:hypothetical protein